MNSVEFIEQILIMFDELEPIYKWAIYIGFWLTLILLMIFIRFIVKLFKFLILRSKGK